MRAEEKLATMRGEQDETMSDNNETDEETRQQAEDRIVANAVEAAIAPYTALLTAAELADARVFLADVLATHPASAELLGQLVAPPQLAQSDKVDVDNPDAPAVDQASGGEE